MVRETTASETFIGKTLIDLKESGGEMGCGEYCECCAGKNCDNCSIQKAFDKLGQYEDTGLEPLEVTAMQEELQSYKQAELDGTIIKLPCKVGDTVYIANNFEKRVCEWVYTSSRQDECGWCAIVIDKETGLKYSLRFDWFGKTVFLTKEEAEKALEGMT